MKLGKYPQRPRIATPGASVVFALLLLVVSNANAEAQWAQLLDRVLVRQGDESLAVVELRAQKGEHRLRRAAVGSEVWRDLALDLGDASELVQLSDAMFAPEVSDLLLARGDSELSLLDLSGESAVLLGRAALPPNARFVRTLAQRERCALLVAEAGGVPHVFGIDLVAPGSLLTPETFANRPVADAWERIKKAWMQVAVHPDVVKLSMVGATENRPLDLRDVAAVDAPESGHVGFAIRREPRSAWVVAQFSPADGVRAENLRLAEGAPIVVSPRWAGITLLCGRGERWKQTLLGGDRIELEELQVGGWLGQYLNWAPAPDPTGTATAFLGLAVPNVLRDADEAGRIYGLAAGKRPQWVDLPLDVRGVVSAFLPTSTGVSWLVGETEERATIVSAGWGGDRVGVGIWRLPR